MSRVTVTVSLGCASDSSVPSEAKFARWVSEVLVHEDPGRSAHVDVRIVDEAEGAALNEQWRARPGATNVLSFPAQLPAEVEFALLGDLVLCAPVVEREAGEQGKAAEAHWAHLTVHGVLHLLGHDHEVDADADRMEAAERVILSTLGYPDPWPQS